jgi:uncharacterized protein (DUF433 family)
MDKSSDLLQRITVDDAICNGKPIIRGLRITVQTVLEFIMAGTPNAEILEQYPALEQADLDACKQFALAMAGNRFTLRADAA